MIVGLSGYAQSGKDTIASILVEEYGFIRVAFADRIRELLFEMDPGIGVKGPDGQWHTVGLQNIVEVSGWDKAKQHNDVRALLQNLGVGARKVFGDDFWIKEALKSLSDDRNFVFTDVRFTNEAEIIKLNHGQVWRIIRPGINPVNQHISESDLDEWPFDGFIDNDGSLEDLEHTIKYQLAWL
jgi:hypothetical protein